MPGALLTLWTIRLALVGYVAAVVLELGGLAIPRRQRQARAAWTAAWLLLVVHVWCAFEFHHHRSHAAAYADTARKTACVVGLDWGGGIYFNYLLLLAWGGDVGWWWSAPAGYLARPRWIGAALHAYLAFLAFNATIVFETGRIRWAGLAACAVVAWAWARQAGRIAPTKE
jgi:hypothetical protein